MMNDYYSQFYEKMFRRTSLLKADAYEKACSMAAWKRKTQLMWDNLKIVENRCHDSSKRPLLLGENFNAEIVIDTAGIPAEEIGVELLFGQKIMDRVDHLSQLRTERIFS
jgi:phosphorylase/glycogen(starch) synthase